VDQRSRVRQLSLDEELLDFLWVIDNTVSAHPLDLRDGRRGGGIKPGDELK
jgi:hypothetical protein